MTRRARARGFTLIETLVALAIAAGVLNGFHAALSTGSLLDRRAEVQAAQALVAASVLDRVGVDIALRPGTQETGTLRGHRWDLAIGDSPPPDLQIGALPPEALVFVSVTVAAPEAGGAPLVLRAIRYAGAPL